MFNYYEYNLLLAELNELLLGVYFTPLFPSSTEVKFTL